MRTNSFSYVLKALYWANDGDLPLSAPMKMYHGFMVDKINEAHSSKLKKLIWRIIHFVTGIFAYPTLGLFAGLDMTIKLVNWNLSRKQHHINDSELKLFISNVHEKFTERYSLPFGLTPNRSSGLKNFREYDIKFGPETEKGQFDKEKKELAKEIKTIIEQFTNAYTNIHMQYSGSWKDGIKIVFLAPHSSLPYCTNPLLPKYEKIVRHFEK